MKKILIAHIPVFDEGYRSFIKKSGAKELYILGRSITHQVKAIASDMRALDPMMLACMLDQTRDLIPIEDGVMMVGARSLKRLAKQKDVEFIFPDEDISHRVVKRFFSGCHVSFASTFLRWDATKILRVLPPDEDIVVSSSEVARKFLRMAARFANKSSDWWLQVGAGARMRDGKILVAFNEHVPPRSQYVNGDPRSNIKPGELVECSTSLHAERALLAEVASRKGMSLRGADVYSTVFPCVLCAQMLERAKIRSVYFRDGFANLNGREIFRQAGVKVIRVVF